VLGETSKIPDRFLQAVANGHIATVRELIQKGTPVNHTDRNGKTALAIAAMNGDIDMMNALLEVGADADGSPKSTLQWLAGGVRMRTDTRRGLAGLGGMAAIIGFASIGFGTVELVAGGFTLLALEVAAAQTPDCYPPLVMAAQYGRTEAVRVLLQAGATINFTDADCHTAVRKAAEHGHFDTLKALLAAGARVDLVDNANQTALMLAARNGYTDILRALIKASAEVDAVAERGRTALILAAENGQTVTLNVLLEAGAKVDRPARYSEEGDETGGTTFDDGTALMFAARNGHTETVRALVEAGAVVPFTLVDIAKRNGHTAAAQILREAVIKALG
jgi:ankyrin repeat protein